MILILLFLVILYFIIKTINLETFNYNDKILNKKKKVSFSDKLDYTEYDNQDDDNNGDNNNDNFNNIKSNNNTFKKNIPSFYTNSYYGSYYIENPNDNELKNIYNNDLHINPIPDDEKKMDLSLLNTNNKIRDIYDEYTNNFKDYDKKKLINNSQSNILEGGSNVSFYTNDMWTYENENIINGGLISDKLMPYDDTKSYNIIY
jgi:hypothetical protein